MRNLYYSHVYPHLIGSITVWGTDEQNKQYIQPLIKTQKKIIRLLKNLPPNTHTTPIMQELKILNITNLYKLRTAVEIHPHIHHNTNEQKTNRPEHDHQYTPTTQIHNHQTRLTNQQLHYIPNPNLLKQAKKTNRKATHTAKHLNTKYIRIWNELPIELREIKKINKFKHELKQHILEQQN